MWLKTYDKLQSDSVIFPHLEYEPLQLNVRPALNSYEIELMYTPRGLHVLNWRKCESTFVIGYINTRRQHF